MCLVFIPFLGKKPPYPWNFWNERSIFVIHDGTLRQSPVVYNSEMIHNRGWSPRNVTCLIKGLRFELHDISPTSVSVHVPERGRGLENESHGQ